MKVSTVLPRNARFSRRTGGEERECRALRAYHRPHLAEVRGGRREGAPRRGIGGLAGALDETRPRKCCDAQLDRGHAQRLHAVDRAAVVLQTLSDDSDLGWLADGEHAVKDENVVGVHHSTVTDR